MFKKGKHGISPSREENFSEWYQQIIRFGDLAENSETRGCMIIKPWGYALWENIQKILDSKLKETGHQNAYFPLLIPLSYLKKEAEHADGFSTECAVVTHSRLKIEKKDGKIEITPENELEEPYIIRPTSETIIGHSFSKWIQSYKDLPLKINQWANVLRWEMRPRLFLRTSEFLWQEGHTAHASEKEAIEETETIQSIYENLLSETLALSSICGKKTKKETFPGAEDTLTLEVMVQNKKAIQAGTSHYLGQNFSKNQNICFTGANGKKMCAYTTSWGVSTRLIGTLIMAHSDDDGLILPPKISPYQIVFIPINPAKDKQEEEKVLEYLKQIKTDIQNEGHSIRMHIDERDMSFGKKKWDWIKKGVPLIVEAGKKEVEGNLLQLLNRLDISKKETLSRDTLVNKSAEKLNSIQNHLLRENQEFLERNIIPCKTLEEFENHWGSQNPRWIITPWEGAGQEEMRLGKKYEISIRCIPRQAFLEERNLHSARCIVSGKETEQWAIWARSY